MATPYAQIAATYDRWQEYADTYGTVSRDEFEQMSCVQRIALLAEVFGPEQEHVEIDA